MRNCIWIILVLFAVGLIGCKNGCAPSKEKAPGPEGAVEVPTAEGTTAEGVTAAPATGAPTSGDIADSISKPLCARVVACAPGTMTESECTAETSKSLKDALDAKPVNITRDQLQACVSSINNGTCDQVMGQKAPAGCEFLD